MITASAILERAELQVAQEWRRGYMSDDVSLLLRRARAHALGVRLPLPSSMPKIWHDDGRTVAFASNKTSEPHDSY
jgi:hypothetical protein